MVNGSIPPFTVQVPIFNTGQYIRPLLDSLVSSGWSRFVDQINLMNDSSTDDTLTVLRQLKQDHVLGEKINVVDLHQNIGRFRITVEGARRARNDWILYINSRSQMQPHFEDAVAKTVAANGTISAIVDVDCAKGPMTLYWDRLHKLLFRQHFLAARERVQIREDNADQLLVGATSMVAKRSTVLAAYDRLGKENVLGDDTTFLREMLKIAPIFLDPGFRILWIPRVNLWPFLHHMFERGPNFVEYHVFLMRDRFAPAAVLGLAYVGLTVGALFYGPQWSGILVLSGLAILAASATLLARGIRDIFVLLPLHVAAMAFFGAGVLWGFLHHFLVIGKNHRPPAAG